LKNIRLILFLTVCLFFSLLSLRYHQESWTMEVFSHYKLRYAIAFSPNLNQCATSDDDFQNTAMAIVVNDEIFACPYSIRTVAPGKEPGNVSLREPNSWTPIELGIKSNSVSFSSTGTVGIIDKDRNSTRIFDTRGIEQFELEVPAVGKKANEISVGSSTLAWASKNYDVEIILLRDKNNRKSARDNSKSILKIKHSMDENTIISIDMDKSLRLWNTRTGDLIDKYENLKTNQIDITSCAAELILSTGNDNVNIINSSSGKLLLRKIFSERLLAAFLIDGDNVIICTETRMLLLGIKTNIIMSQISLPDRPIYVGINSGRRKIAIMDDNKQVTVYQSRHVSIKNFKLRAEASMWLSSGFGLAILCLCALRRKKRMV